MNNSDRWAVAIHEAAHCVCAIALGGQCSRLSIGMAVLHRLSDFNYAVAMAAPTAALELLADALPPEIEPAPELLDAADSLADLPPAEQRAYTTAISAGVATDSQTIARYCTSGLELEPPERWVDRYYLIHHHAYQVVRDHQAAILAVARELFARGVLSKSEIEEAMK